MNDEEESEMYAQVMSIESVDNTSSLVDRPTKQTLGVGRLNYRWLRSPQLLIALFITEERALWGQYNKPLRADYIIRECQGDRLKIDNMAYNCTIYKKLLFELNVDRNKFQQAWYNWNK